MRIRRLAVLGVTCFAAAAIACSSTPPGGGPSTPEDGGSTADVASADASTGNDGGGTGGDASSTVSATIGPSGGSVTTPGATLSIPSGALPADTVISITPNGGPIPASYTGLSSLFTFGPDGTTFLQPVTVTFTVADTSGATVYWSNSSGGYDALATTTTATTASASVTHFSKGFCGRGGGGNHDAGTESDATTSGSDASTTSDASTSSNDAAGAETGASDAAAAETGTNDASSKDAAPNSDAGLDGIVATIDNVQTTFTYSPSATYQNGLATVQANDSAGSSYWQLQITVIWNQPQQSCTLQGFPRVKLVHYAGTVADQTFTSTSCAIVVTSVAQTTGQKTAGQVVTATVVEPVDGGTVSHTISQGTFSVTM
jgi:hypothetical protein